MDMFGLALKSFFCIKGSGILTKLLTMKQEVAKLLNRDFLGMYFVLYIYNFRAFPCLKNEVKVTFVRPVDGNKNVLVPVRRQEKFFSPTKWILRENRQNEFDNQFKLRGEGPNID